MNYISEKLIKEGVLSEFIFGSLLKLGKGEYKAEVRELYITRKDKRDEEYQVRTILLIVGDPFKRKFGPTKLDHMLWFYDFDSYKKTGYTKGLYLDSRSLVQPRFTKKELYERSTFLESGTVFHRHYWILRSPFANKHFYENFKGFKLFKRDEIIRSRYDIGQYARYVLWGLFPYIGPYAQSMRWYLNQNCGRGITRMSHIEEPESPDDITPEKR